MRRSWFAPFLVVVLAACGRVGDDLGSNASGHTPPEDASRTLEGSAPHTPDASTKRTRDASALPPSDGSPDAGPPPTECVAPCLWDLVSMCHAPRMLRCYRDGDTLCDPDTGWSLTRYDLGMAGSGRLLAHDGTVCLESSGGGASPVPGITYFAPSHSDNAFTPVRPEYANVFTDDAGTQTRCELTPNAPVYYTSTGDAACAGWHIEPMRFDCATTVPGTCPVVTKPF